MGAAALSIPHWRSFQTLRHLHVRVGLGTAGYQQRVRDVHYGSDLLDRSPNFRRASGCVVGVELGAMSVCLVLVDPLDLGYDFHPVCSGVVFSRRSGVGRMAGLARVDSFWRAVWRWSTRESDDAGVPALLRALDLAASLPARLVFPARRGSGFAHVFSGAVAVAGAELFRVRAFCFFPERFRIAGSTGQRSFGRRHADAIFPAESE